MKNTQEHHAYQRYLAFNSEYPDIKDEYKKFDKWYFENKAKKGVRDGIYVPAYAIPEQSDYVFKHFLNQMRRMNENNLMPYNMSEDELRVMRFLNAFKMFLAWRMSLSIYRIDDYIFDEMLKSEIPGDSPSEVFKRLPDFCVYVEFPKPTELSAINGDNLLADEFMVKGFWAYLNHPLNDKNGIELHLCVDVEEHPDYPEVLSTVSMIIEDDTTLEESADKVIDQYIGMSKEAAYNMAESDKKTLYALLPMLLWLCAEEPDISSMTGEPLTMDVVRQPKYGVKKKTGQFIPPSNPKVFHLGQRLGGKIKQFEDKMATGEYKSKGTKRPHVRKGHWHNYWVGTGQNKHYEPRWIPTIFINV